MKTLIIIPVLLLSLLFGAPSYSANFNKGLDAYSDGDFVTAFKEWQPLAEEGLAEAQYNLGWLYANGKGVIRDYKEAVKWFKLSTEQENASSQRYLAYMYTNGLGVPKDFNEAVRLGRLAAEQGDVEAQHNLGNRYIYGEGVIKDLVYAYMWKNIAASNGLEEAREHLKMLEKEMTSSQIEEAQRFARECVKKNYKGC